MNPEIRGYMHYRYGTRYFPYFFYGTHSGYGFPPYGMGYLPYYHPYYHQLDHYLIHHLDHQQEHHPEDLYFGVPLGGPAR